MNVLILGAGASKSYSDSLTQEKMPVAKDFFKTFNKLKIAENEWVLIGQILNYLKVFHKQSWMEFIDYNEDIEILYTEVNEKLNEILKRNEGCFSRQEDPLVFQTYMQLVFVFTSVINEIQNGGPSISHVNLAENLLEEDIVLTFNWDTLMDRALKITKKWNPDNGYFVNPSMIYRDNWVYPILTKTIDYPLILKLHGSTNWLTGYLRPDKSKLKSMQETPVEDFFIYESTLSPYSTYKGRYMDGYSEYSYGYYPPNLPLKGEEAPKGYLLIKTSLKLNGDNMSSPSDGLESMPLIIPPVHEKDYDYFGNIFRKLWSKAEDSLIKAERIIIIGYSFPVTDTQTDILFKKAFIQRSDQPEIVIVDPFPDNIVDKFVYDYGISKNMIRVYRSYFNKDFNTKELFKKNGR
jgi:hypothetical protein